MLQFMGKQRVRHDLVTEQQQYSKEKDTQMIPKEKEQEKNGEINLLLWRWLLITLYSERKELDSNFILIERTEINLQVMVEIASLNGCDLIKGKKGRLKKNHQAPMK